MLAALPIIGFVLFLWWFSTGAIFFLCGLPDRRRGATMVGATVILCAALWTVWSVRGLATPTGAYLAFAAGLGVWAWGEISLLLGVVTGPRRAPCPADATGWRRFGLAVATLLYHEIALLCGALALFALTYGAENTLAFWTYLALWAMRISAKLNVFLGVPNMSHDFVSPRLAYLSSYFRRAPSNPLFAVVVTAGSGATILAIMQAVWAMPGSFDFALHTMLATILGLAVLEHWFMVLPVQDAALWRWFTARAARRDDARRRAGLLQRGDATISG